MRLVIILLTYARTDYALRTIAGIAEYLQFAGDVGWYVADDGSGEEHVAQVAAAIADSSWPIVGQHSERIGYGRGANRAWQAANQDAPLTLWLEDDWVLTRPLNVMPYAQLLTERADVSMVRLGYMPVGLDLRSVGYAGNMYLQVLKGQQYAFSGNPHLKHERFMSYGPYPTGLNPGETEVAYDHQIRTKEGPQIWWPLLIGDDPFFAHIGNRQSY